jgi:hypothetical protein
MVGVTGSIPVPPTSLQQKLQRSAHLRKSMLPLPSGRPLRFSSQASATSASLGLDLSRADVRNAPGFQTVEANISIGCCGAQSCHSPFTLGDARSAGAGQGSRNGHPQPCALAAELSKRD